MKRQHPLMSLPGCLATLLLMACIIASVVVTGGRLFNPGPVSASTQSGVPLEGYSSHADFENACERCHAPWRGPSDVRCVACHSDIQSELTAGSGLHAEIPREVSCDNCHSDHQGRDFSSAAQAVLQFDHTWTGFYLNEHQQDFDGSSINCTACHGLNYSVSMETCSRCHSDYDNAFMTGHIAAYGQDCLGCHDGRGGALGLEQAHVNFPLEGGHAGLECQACHAPGASFQSIAGSECVACHMEPEIHVGQFGTNCAACHSITNWTDVLLKEHVFPLDHAQRNGQVIACEVCHPTNYVSYTCYASNCHSEGEIRGEHLEEGISDFADCNRCHPTGREEEGEGRERDD